MGRYITQPPLTRPIKKQRVFTLSGIFTPSQKLLDAGGVVTVRCVGGGGSGYGHPLGGGAGSSGMDITRVVTVTAPVVVTIGAGGIPSDGSGGQNYYGSDGGTTSFGSLLVARGGKKGRDYYGGSSSGEGSLPGSYLQRENNVSIGGYGGGAGSAPTENAPENSGGGGGARANPINNIGGKGGSGLCIVTWEE